MRSACAKSRRSSVTTGSSSGSSASITKKRRRRPGNTGDALMSLLERRLDNVVTRLGFAVSRPQSRQLITHGHIMVNGRKLDIPSYLVRPGDQIQVKNREHSRKIVTDNVATGGGPAGPGLAGPDQHRPARGAHQPVARCAGRRAARDTSVDHRVVEPLTRDGRSEFWMGRLSMRIRWRGLELPSRVICNRETLTDTFGEFHVEPFERGFGHTVGNSLRRILLSSLEGSAITKIKIHGVQHEFSSIPGMVDDITDLVLERQAARREEPLRIGRGRSGSTATARASSRPPTSFTTNRSRSSIPTTSSARLTATCRSTWK